MVEYIILLRKKVETSLRKNKLSFIYLIFSVLFFLPLKSSGFLYPILTFEKICIHYMDAYDLSFHFTTTLTLSHVFIFVKKNSAVTI